MTERRHIVLAFLLALFVHLAFLVATWDVDLLGVYAPPEPKPEESTTVELVLEPEPEPATVVPPDGPQTYTSVPERQEVEAPPADPDFLALRNSRAADRLEGGEATGSPGTETVAEVDQVAIRRDAGGTAGDASVLLTPAERARLAGGGDRSEGEGAAAGGSSAGEAQQGDLRSGEEGAASGEAGPGVELLEPYPELADLLAAALPSILADQPGAPGDRGFEYDQEQASRGGNLIQFGEFALSTLDWDFAPWLESFKRDFLPNWIPPYAYQIGVIEGRTLLKMVVELDGTVSSIEVVDSAGHPSLHSASVAAVRATAPLKPLPGHFPDPELVLGIELFYSPRVVQERPTRPAQAGPGGSRPPRRR